MLTKVSETEREELIMREGARIAHTEVHHCECRSVTHRYACPLANIVYMHALIIIIIMAEDAPDQVRTARHNANIMCLINYGMDIM